LGPLETSCVISTSTNTSSSSSSSCSNNIRNENNNENIDENNNNNNNNNKRKRKRKRKRKNSKNNPPKIESINFLHFNPRGLPSKEAVIKQFMAKHKVSYGGLAKSHTYRNAHLSDKRWDWQPGSESRPGPCDSHPPGGIAMLVDRGLSHSIVHAGKYVVWSRIETNDSEPIFVAECYFPHSSETTKHKQAWDELESKADEYRLTPGHLLIMGDFNAHTGLDQSKVDTAGRLLLKRTESLGLHMINGTSTCTGSITRTEEQADGKYISTAIDYVFVSQSLLPTSKV